MTARVFRHLVTITLLATMSLGAQPSDQKPAPGKNLRDMHIVEACLFYSARDTEVLEQLRKQGDDPTITRDIDFALGAPDRKKADLVASFVTDNHYGAPKVTGTDGAYRIEVVVHASVGDFAIHAMSANMVHLAHMFSIEYIGWGCPVMKPSDISKTK